jgi:hypothetical protein
MEKVKLPRDVAWAIEKMDLFEVAKSIAQKHDPENWPERDTVFKYAHDHPDQMRNLFMAMANGWETELAPEEAVKEYYKIISERSSRESDPTTMMNFEFEAAGIIATLNKLGIKIEGVNT